MYEFIDHFDRCGPEAESRSHSMPCHETVQDIFVIMLIHNRLRCLDTLLEHFELAVDFEHRIVRPYCDLINLAELQAPTGGIFNIATDIQKRTKELKKTATAN